MNFSKSILSQLVVLACFIVPFSVLGQDILRPEDLMKGLSDEVQKELRSLKAGDPHMKSLLEKANQQLADYCKGKSGKFTLVIYDVDTQSSEKNNILLQAKDTQDRLLGKTMTLKQGFLLDDSLREQATKIKRGERVTATGTPWGLIAWSKGQFEFNFWLGKATLK